MRELDGWDFILPIIVIGAILIIGSLIHAEYKRSNAEDIAEKYCGDIGMMYISNDFTSVKCATPNSTHIQIYYVDLSQKQVRE